MSAAARRRQRGGDESLDVELADLPAAARWREWMLRVCRAAGGQAGQAGATRVSKTFRPMTLTKTLTNMRANGVRVVIATC
jgi:hypothetical protein